MPAASSGGWRKGPRSLPGRRTGSSTTSAGAAFGFKELQTLIVQEPEGETRADFVKDVQFIFAKITERPQVILFAHSPLNEENELFKLLHHPAVLDAGAPAPAAAEASTTLLCRCRGHGAYGASGADHPGLPRLLRHRALRAAGRPAEDRGGAAAARASRAAPAARQRRRCGRPRSAAERRRALVSFAQGEGDVLLAPLAAGALAAAEREELSPSHVIFFDLPAGGVRPAVGIGRGSTIVALADPGQEKELSKLQEAVGVAISRREIPSDEEVLTGAIDRVLKRMQDEDKGELAAAALPHPQAGASPPAPAVHGIPAEVAAPRRRFRGGGSHFPPSETGRAARTAAPAPARPPRPPNPRAAGSAGTRPSGPAPARGPRSAEGQPGPPRTGGPTARAFLPERQRNSGHGLQQLRRGVVRHEQLHLPPCGNPLPAGLSLNAATGLLDSTPSAINSSSPQSPWSTMQAPPCPRSAQSA